MNFSLVIACKSKMHLDCCRQMERIGRIRDGRREIERPLVSVVIPRYKCEKYISEALDSVLRQTYPNLEIIVVNDCSPESEAIIFKYMKKDVRIQY